MGFQNVKHFLLLNQLIIRVIFYCYYYLMQVVLMISDGHRLLEEGRHKLGKNIGKMDIFVEKISKFSQISPRSHTKNT